MTLFRALRAAAAAGALALAGCVAQDGFPSLAPRAVESQADDEEVSRPIPVAAADPALRRRIAELSGEAEAGERAFAAALPAAERAVASAGAAESEGWVVAQQALSRLESTRAATTRALAELDALALARADRPTSPVDSAALDSAVAAAAALAQRQQARIDRLRERLSR